MSRFIFIGISILYKTVFLQPNKLLLAFNLTSTLRYDQTNHLLGNRITVASVIGNTSLKIKIKNDYQEE